MSVTFWCPDAPSHKEDCAYCDGSGACDVCDGSGEAVVSDAPEVNFSNSNARDVLGLLEMPVPLGSDIYGTVKHADIPVVLRRIMFVAGVDRIRAPLVSSGYVEKGEQGCTMIVGGSTDEDTIRRVEKLRTLFSWAATHGYDVSWG